MIKFRKYYVEANGKKARVHYSVDGYADGKKNITIYAKDYMEGTHLRDVFAGQDVYHNNTDTQSDYFEKGRVVLFEDHPLYATARPQVDAIKAALKAKRGY